MAKFRIWCRVSGGLTGTREAWLKKRNGKIYETKNRTTAQKEASRLNKTMGKNSMASFRYSVEEIN